MSYRGQEIGPILDFSGGQNSTSPPDAIANNEGVEVENLIVMPRGLGIRTRDGDTAFNSSAMNSGANVQGGLYYKQADGTEFLMAIAGNAIFKSDSLDGTMDDITGGATITAGQTNTWTPFVAENEAIWVGGAPDTPLKWTGTGNVASLGGSPPSGNFGFYHNNRAFIGNTTANPSRINWSVLDNIEDWSSSGSGSADILTNDGDTLVGAAPISEYIVLLFKQNSIHKLIGRTDPFPVVPFVTGVGAVSKHAIVTVDGLAYFITPKGRMKVTDGDRIYDERDLPRLRNIDDVWDGLNSSRLTQITGKYVEGKDFRHIVWCAPNGSSTTNDTGIVWDLVNQCWIKHPDGFNANVLFTKENSTMYGGHTNGIIYQKYNTAATTDASESSAAITSKWRTGWQHFGSLQRAKLVDFMYISAQTETGGGNLNVRVGADFSADLILKSIDLTSPGGKWGVMQWGVGSWGGRATFINPAYFIGIRGNVLQFSFDNKNNAAKFQLNQYSLTGDVDNPKTINVP